MRTKFILQGGFAREINAQNDQFYQEILKDLPSAIRVLLVYFAKDEHEYEGLKARQIEQFERNAGNRSFIYEIAQKENLEEQIKKSHVIYIQGGKTLKLLEVLKGCPNLGHLFEGKVVAGDSAGAYVLSTYFYSKSEGGVFEGLGFVPAKTICHYIGENAERLSDCPGNLDTVLLADFQYKVYIR